MSYSCLRGIDALPRLKQIENALRLFQEVRDEFIKSYPNFKKTRLWTISKLEEMLECILKYEEREKSGTRAVMGFFGFSALVMMTPLVGPVAFPVAAAAAGINLAYGGIFCPFYHCVSMHRHAKKQKCKIKDILGVDSYQAEQLMKWIQRSDEVIAAIGDFMDYENFKQIMAAVFRGNNKIELFEGTSDSEMVVENLKMYIEKMSLSQEEKEKVKALFQRANFNGNFLKRLTVIAGLYFSVRESVEAVRVSLPAIAAIFGVTLGPVGAALAVVIFSGVSFVANFINLGSEETALEIVGRTRQCINILRRELDAMEIIYNELTRNDRPR